MPAKVSRVPVPGNPVARPGFWVECPDCGLGQALPEVAAGSLAACRRCRRVLAANPGVGLDAALALALTALILLLYANAAPLMSVSGFGDARHSFAVTGVTELAREGFLILAALVAAFSIAAPLAYLGLLIAALGGVATGTRAPWLGRTFRWALGLRPWAMPEIFVVGGFVAYSRLETMARVEIGAGGWAMLAAALAFLAIDAALDRDAVWRAIAPPPARQAAGIACLGCGWIMPHDAGGTCPRCGAALHRRKPHALSRTAALLLAAYLLYIPANLLPVLTIERYGRVESDTIMAGIRVLAEIGAWPLAVIVFVASILIPLLKLLSLTWFMIARRRGSRYWLVARTRLHAVVGGIGRWSNIDVFMGSIVVALVQFDTLANVSAGPGGTAFAAVVAITMIASREFDARLMWDATEDKP